MPALTSLNRPVGAFSSCRAASASPPPRTRSSGSSRAVGLRIQGSCGRPAAARSSFDRWPAGHYTHPCVDCSCRGPGAGTTICKWTLPESGGTMLRILGSPRTLCDGLTRRDFLCAGGLSLLGAGAASYLPASEQSRALGRSFGKAKSCILLFLYGSPSQLET